MSELIVSGCRIALEHYWDGEIYNQSMLEKWQKDKATIFCSCQQFGIKVEMHVRKTKLGKYTLVNNPLQSDRHTPACMFYRKVERSSVEAFKRPPVVHEGNRIIFHVHLFREYSEKEGSILPGPVKDISTPGEYSRSDPNIIVDPKRRPTFSFSDFIFNLYQEAIKEIRKERKKRTPATLLYTMWRLMLDHRIWVGSEDFYYKGYIPNGHFKRPRYRKIVLGWVKEEREHVDGGKRWIVEGVAKNRMEFLVKKKHLPDYPVIDKLAALRVNFIDGKEPYTISPAKAWRISQEGWWLHSEVEWKFLREVQERGYKVIRPLYPSAAWFGYQPDFVITLKSRSVFVDIINEHDEPITVNDFRTRQQEIFQAANKEGIIHYDQWHAGDPTVY